MKLRSPAGLAGIALSLSLAVPGAAAAQATLNVRAEGATSTVLPRTAVTTTTATVNKDGVSGHDCTGTSAAGALERATAGNWAGTWFNGLGYAVDRVLAETANPATSYWSFWLNYRYSDSGICGVEVQAGDDVLLYVDCFSGCTPRTPLRLSRVPAVAAPGSSADVLVETFTAVGFPSVTTPSPAAGATVTVGAQSYTTDANGIARVTFSGSGPVSLRATRDAASVPSATEQTCVTTGTDGSCGSVVPDTTAPTAAVAGIRNGQTFRRKRAPRELKGSVSADPSGLWAVKIRLTRRLGKTCWYFSGSKEAFLKRTCGKRYAFKVGDREEWTYLLPSRLPRGRYVLDVYGIDNAFNKGTPERVAFRVR
jgi:hypothetical protein